MKTYLVGGAVRDQLLGLPVRERDWVVIGASEGQMLELGFRRLACEFPVFLHPETGDEYALARTERKTGLGYKGFVVDAGLEISLEQDLLRRDLTINALARDEQGQLVDPLGGCADLDARLLRHITPAFVEDPVRLLRIARFAARLGRWGFRVAEGTDQLLRQVAAGDDLMALRPERLWREMSRALDEDQPWRFFEVLHDCGALARLIPELALEMENGHLEADLPPVLAALRRAVVAGHDLTVRFAVVFQGLVGSDEVDGLCSRLRAGREQADLLGTLVRFGSGLQAAAAAAPEALLDLLEQSRALSRPERFEQLLQAARSLWPEAISGLDRLGRARGLATGISGRDLMAEGLRGPAVGSALRQRRLAAIAAADDACPGSNLD